MMADELKEARKIRLWEHGHGSEVVVVAVLVQQFYVPADEASSSCCGEGLRTCRWTLC